MGAETSRGRGAATLTCRVLAGGIVFVAGYALSLGPVLYVGERWPVPDVVWDAYWPIFFVQSYAPQWLQDIYYDQYLCLWSEWLPYDYLVPRMREMLEM